MAIIQRNYINSTFNVNANNRMLNCHFHPVGISEIKVECNYSYQTSTVYNHRSSDSYQRRDGGNVRLE